MLLVNPQFLQTITAGARYFANTIGIQPFKQKEIDVLSFQWIKSLVVTTVSAPWERSGRRDTRCHHPTIPSFQLHYAATHRPQGESDCQGSCVVDWSVLWEAPSQIGGSAASEESPTCSLWFYQAIPHPPPRTRTNRFSSSTHLSIYVSEHE